MSRFYDAFKHAGQSLRVPQETPGGEQGEAWEAAVIDDPATLTISEVGAGAEAAALLAEEPSEVPVGKEPLLSKPASKNGSFGIPTQVVLDMKARLIPHSVDPTLVEHYRILRTRILQRQKEKKYKSLLVTSPAPREGKTVTVLNLGLIFARLPSFKVLVLDGDLRKGSLGEWLGVRDRPGFSNLIAGKATLEEVVLKSEEISMDFIIRGNSEASAGELLNSVQLPTYFRKMSERYDLVLVDSPPINLVTDAQLLASSCDAALLVARAFSTNCKALEEANQNLQQIRVIGTVLNGGTGFQSYPRYRSYY